MRSKDSEDLLIEHKHLVVLDAAGQFLVNLLPASLCKTTLSFLLKIPTHFLPPTPLQVKHFGLYSFSKVILSKIHKQKPKRCLTYSIIAASSF